MTLGTDLTAWFDATIDDTATDLSGNSVTLAAGGGGVSVIADTDDGGTDCWQPTTNTGHYGETGGPTDFYGGGTGDFAAVCWVRGASIGNILSQRDLTSSPNKGWVLYNSGGVLRMLLNAGSNVFATGTTTITDGSWHMVVGQRNSGNIEVFTDGGDKQSTSFTGDITPGTAATSMQWWRQYGSASPWATPKIDAVRFYDRALTDSEVSTLYTEQRGYDHTVATNTPHPLSGTAHPLGQPQPAGSFHPLQ